MKITAALVFLLGTSLTFAQVSTVTFTNLNNLGKAKGINISNTVVGYTLGGDEVQGFVYQNGTATPLMVPGAIQTEVHGIENNGRIVGAYNNDDHKGSHGFLYFHGSFTTIDCQNALSTVARAINDPQTIVGDFKDNSGHSHGFVYDQKGTCTQVDVPNATDTYPEAINNPGDIAGHFIDSTGHHHGFLLQSSGKMQTIDVPFAGATDTFVTGINASGVMVGHYVDNGGTHGFVNASGVFLSFDAPGTPPSTGTLVGGINNNGSFVVFGSAAYLAQAQ